MFVFGLFVDVEGFLDYCSDVLRYTFENRLDVLLVNVLPEALDLSLSLLVLFEIPLFLRNFDHLLPQIRTMMRRQEAMAGDQELVDSRIAHVVTTETLAGDFDTPYPDLGAEV